MDSLIGMRYLFDTLQPDEQAEAIKRITVECGTQWIMTSIFSHLARRLHHNSEDKPMIAAITKEISSVIVERNTKAQSHDVEAPIIDKSDFESDADDSPVSIEDIPSVMISKIGSYLNQIDYIHFMHSSRGILIGCHSPSALYHLNVHEGNYKKRGVRDAVSVRSLALYDIQRHNFLKTAEKYPNNSNIERLAVSTESIVERRRGPFEFGRRRPNMLSSVTQRDFFQFMQSFSNVKCIDALTPMPFWSSALTENDIPTMPALKGLVYHSKRNTIGVIEYYLIRKHMTQIESLKFVSRDGFKESSSDLTLPNLTELKLVNESRQFLNREVLFKRIKQLQGNKLRIISVDCSRVSCVSELITFLIGNQPDLQFMEFVFEAMDKNIMAIMQHIGNGLVASKLKEETKVNENMELRVRIRYTGNRMVQKEMERDNDHERRFIGGFGYLAQVFEGCNVRHFMVQVVMRSVDWMQIAKDQKAVSRKRFYAPTGNQTFDLCSNKQTLGDLVMKLREEYRVDTYCESRGKANLDEGCIVVCNKDNPMKGGYRAHGLFVE